VIVIGVAEIVEDGARTVIVMVDSGYLEEQYDTAGAYLANCDAIIAKTPFGHVWLALTRSGKRSTHW